MTSKLISLICTVLILSGCQKSSDRNKLVIWITGNLECAWHPRSDSAHAECGGLLRIARALEMYRQPEELLLDLGRFCYPAGIDGDLRGWRIRSNGFIKALARLNYDALCVSLQDLSPWPPELATFARDVNLPIISGNIGEDSLLFPPLIKVIRSDGKTIQIIGLSGSASEFIQWIRPLEDNLEPRFPECDFRIVIANTPFNYLTRIHEITPDIDLIFWLNDGLPTVAEINGTPVLGMGSFGGVIGRVVVEDINREKISLESCDLSGWLDGKASRHHPLRERVIFEWFFWKKPVQLSAYIWAIPASISPQKEAEKQMRQTIEEDSRLADLEEIHRHSQTEYAGPERCLSCHDSKHSENLPQIHQPINQAEIAEYPVYERCLNCHATGFDNPGGFLLPWERPDLQWVSCEACHRGSYNHALEGSPPYPPVPDRDVCLPCHRTESRPSDHP